MLYSVTANLPDSTKEDRDNLRTMIYDIVQNSYKMDVDNDNERICDNGESGYDEAPVVTEDT